MLERAGVNEEREFFSYEHFYVIFCNFYMLDTGEKDHLTPFDLSRYSNGGKFCCDRKKLLIWRIISNCEAIYCVELIQGIIFDC